MEKLTLDRNELANAMGISVETLNRRRKDGLILDPLRASHPARPMWSKVEVEEWVALGTPTRDEWRERRKLLVSKPR